MLFIKVLLDLKLTNKLAISHLIEKKKCNLIMKQSTVCLQSVKTRCEVKPISALMFYFVES